MSVDGAVDPQDVLRAALGELRDQTASALREARLSDLEDGLKLYEELMLAALQQFEDLRELVQTPPISWRGGYGREMDWLVEDAATLVAVAVQSSSPEAISIALGLPFELLVEGVRRRMSGLVKTALDLYARCWREGLALPPESIVWKRARHSILLQIENAGDYYIAPLRRTDVEAADGYAAFLFSTLAELARTVLDAARPEDLSAVLRTIREVFAPAENRRAQRRLPWSAGPGHDIRTLKSMLVLGLNAYVLMLFDLQRIDVVTARDLIARVGALGADRPGWDDYIAAYAQGDSVFSWYFWETALRAERGGVIQFDHYLTLAFVLLLARGFVGLRVAPSGAPEDTRFYVERVIEGLRTITEREPYLQLGPFPSAQVVQEKAEQLFEELQRAVQDQVALLALSQERLTQFVDAVRAEWHAQSQQHPQLRARADEPPNGDDSAYLLFGFNNLVPKDYFAETHVFADPKDLAAEYIRALVRGEKEYWLRQVGAAARSLVTPTERFRDVVKEQLRAQRSAGFVPEIVVFRDWRLMDELREDPMDVTRSPDSTTLDGARVTLSFEDVEFSCIVADFAAVGELRYERMVARRTGDQVIEAGRLLVGVESIDTALAESLFERNPRLATTGDETGVELPEAIHRLRQRVVVRLLERISVVLSPALVATIVTVSRAEPDLQ